jgi:hypothetical protein
MTITINGSGTITGVTTMDTTVVNQVFTTPKATTTIGVGNATPSASGSGVSFPATQSASSDANTLDDYEEGTFTATLTGLVSNPSTPVTTTATYTKIGNLVYINIAFESVTTTGASGQVIITGLPFTNSGNRKMIPAGFFIASWPAGTTPIGEVAAGSTSIYANALTSAAGWGTVTHNAGSGRYFWYTGSYQV